MISSVILLLTSGILSSQVGDNTGVTESSIKVGMSTVLSGSAAVLGQEMKRGVESYFAHTNDNGGIHGRKITLVALDDGYEPNRTAPNMRTLINKEHVFSVIGNVGTPTAVVSVPIANEEKVPLFGALTGAGLLRRSPPDRYIINFRASYNQEMKAMIDGLVDGVGIPPERIAFFTQNDAYGDAGFFGAKIALENRGYKYIIRNIHGRYQRNTVNIEDGLERILDARVTPMAVIMVGTYKACSKFVNLARSEFLNAIFLNLSFVGAENLASNLAAKSEGRVIITQVVPPTNSSLPAVKSYRDYFGKSGHTFNSLEGWLAATAFVEALKLTGKNLSRETFIDALESEAPVDLGLGATHKLSKNSHQFSQKVWPTVWKNKKWQTFSWKSMKKVLGRQLAKLETR